MDWSCITWNQLNQLFSSKQRKKTLIKCIPNWQKPCTVCFDVLFSFFHISIGKYQTQSKATAVWKASCSRIRFQPETDVCDNKGFQRCHPVDYKRSRNDNFTEMPRKYIRCHDANYYASHKSVCKWRYINQTQ